MTSRRLSSPSLSASASHRHHVLHLAVAVSASSLLLLVLVLLVLFYFYLSLRRSPTLPLPSNTSPATAANPLRLRRFSYRALRSATASFDPSRSLGRGASAAVFRGVLPDGKSVAVKRLLSSSASCPSSPTRAASSDREFHNELHVLATLLPSPFVVSLLGYCLEGRRRRLLVYEYMPNGSLQEALFGSSSPLNWDRRFSIILDVAQALAFLHLQCDPPVVHGDIKPSNVLLGFDFQAKISDFGLSQMKVDANLGADFFSQDLGQSQELFKSQEDLAPESPQVDFALALRASSSIPCKKQPTPRGKETVAVASPVQDETFSFEHSKESRADPPLDEGRTESSDQLGKRWWWKQDGSGELSSKDYVREWIGSQICPSSNSDWDDGRRTPPEKCFDFRNSSRVEHSDVGDESLFGGSHERNPEKKQGRKKGVLPCDRKMREWWKEEYLAEMSKKGHCQKERKWLRTISDLGDDANKHGRDLTADAGFRKGWRKKRSQSVGSDMFSGDLLSRELSSTTSMRGTVCYVAPECHGCDQLMEKADIYSFGVLILVIVSGRRPLHVLPSPAKPEKASLVSWCRRLLQTGNLLELVDERLTDAYDKEQASLCINLALLCLQRIPELRPDGGDVVRILKGEMELPAVPCEFSPSPPAKHHGRSRRKASMDEE
ncbi:putative receptor-like protein kinase At1g80870 [Musa acuminata AAA Group]|uniref:putative receptor-like protein kinase At1g80870 n=1 Tax=Musa acuminata AAA Group TaxID=214697 RepID=UPI0031D43F12